MRRLLSSLLQAVRPAPRGAPAPAAAPAAQAAPATADALRIVEMDPADAGSAELFARVFKQTIPAFPRHFALLWDGADGTTRTLGYVHQTPFEDGRAHLSGGLVVDAWLLRRLPPALQERVRAQGGMAEWLMRASMDLCEPSVAFYACIGEPRSRTVNTRIGFRPAGGHQHLYVRPGRDATDAGIAALTGRIAQIGLF